MMLTKAELETVLDDIESHAVARSKADNKEDHDLLNAQLAKLRSLIVAMAPTDRK